MLLCWVFEGKCLGGWHLIGLPLSTWIQYSKHTKKHAFIHLPPVNHISITMFGDITMNTFLSSCFFLSAFFGLDKGGLCQLALSLSMPLVIYAWQWFLRLLEEHLLQACRSRHRANRATNKLEKKTLRPHRAGSHAAHTAPALARLAWGARRQFHFLHRWLNCC